LGCAHIHGPRAIAPAARAGLSAAGAETDITWAETFGAGGVRPHSTRQARGRDQLGAALTQHWVAVWLGGEVGFD
jgi:hypothetical protein